ncbi:hypothetical protein QA645_19810 [Bradyrhizobium sp. CIAT3101]|uniref:DUF7660 family protein n=1 Tax=Bradyrhizobium sp. CIAT3101 TaxID=439387 RepID=UPI0024B089AD|nr:hypothetical protein [Bradyrhizobium sp. CIAT3101]WFU84901.1 hypothetical protein QA645_19810 [Bradyrhizobium sp. CIAT3101]
MDLSKLAESVSSRSDFVIFVDALRRDLLANRGEWENDTLERFLEALSGWVQGMDGYYRNQQLPTPTTPGWKNLAEMMLAAKFYE